MGDEAGNAETDKKFDEEQMQFEEQIKKLATEREQLALDKAENEAKHDEMKMMRRKLTDLKLTTSQLLAKRSTLTSTVQKLKTAEAKHSKASNANAAKVASLRSAHVKELELLKQLKAHQAAKSAKLSSGPSVAKLQNYAQTAIRYYMDKFGIAWIDIKTRQFRVGRNIKELPKEINKFKKFPF